MDRLTVPAVGGTRRAAQFAAAATWEDLPADVRRTARLAVLDTIGCAVVAWSQGTSAELLNTVRGWSGGGSSTAWSGEADLASAEAAFFNGVLAHTLDYDDIHPGSSAHTSAVVVPAAWAVAEEQGATYGEMLCAVAVGTEVATAIGVVVPSGMHERGFHATSVTGVFGAVAAVGVLRRLPADTIQSAMGLAGSMASGLLVYVHDGTETKPMHAGWSAQSGIRASDLAAAGVQGPPSVLEGRYGLIDAFLADAFSTDQERRTAVDTVMAGLGSRWRGPELTPKLYPSCYFMHPWLDAAREVASRTEGAPVERLHIELPTEVAARLVDPFPTGQTPTNPYSAKFNLAYCLATLLGQGSLRLGAFEPEALHAPGTLALMGTTTFEAVEQADWASAPRGALSAWLANGARLSVRLKAGSRATSYLNQAEEVRAKFSENAGTISGNAASVQAFADALLVGSDQVPVTSLSRSLTKLQRRSSKELADA